MTRRSILRLALLTAVVGGGCDGGPTLPSVSGNEGALKFRYSGARSGTYVAAGNPSGGGTSAAYAQPTADGTTVVRTSARNPDGSAVTVFLYFPTPAAPTTIAVDWSECPRDGFCAGGQVFFSPATPSAITPSEQFGYSEGTIRITAAGAGRIRGTFGGRAHAATGSGAVNIRDGEFDLPLLANP